MADTFQPDAALLPLLPVEERAKYRPAIDGAAAAIIIRIADIAEAVGWQAGVGGMETAGQIVSYLSRNPDRIEQVLREGILDLPTDWFCQGRLTWHAQNGQIVSPEFVRRRSTIKKMERGNGR